MPSPSRLLTPPLLPHHPHKATQSRSSRKLLSLSLDRLSLLAPRLLLSKPLLPPLAAPLPRRVVSAVTHVGRTAGLCEGELASSFPFEFPMASVDVPDDSPTGSAGLAVGGSGYAGAEPFLLVAGAGVYVRLMRLCEG